MNDKDLKSLFEATEAVSPRPESKTNAIDAAMSSFDEDRSSGSSLLGQGNADSDRPTSNITNLFGGKSMSTLNQRWIAGGMASAAVVVIAVTLTFNLDPAVEAIPAMHPTPLDQALSEPVEYEEIEVSKRTNKQNPNNVGYSTTATPKLSLSRLQRSDFGESAMPEQPGARPIRNFADASMVADAHRVPHTGQNTDSFQHQATNPVKAVRQEPVSTFSIDVDTASYSFVRRQLNQGVLPRKSAVRLEEMVNYFPYDYPAPETREIPFATHVSVMESPWNPANRLVHIGIKGYEKLPSEKTRSNLVFLLDVSGSMNQADKLPLVKQSMGMLLSQLQPEDTVAIVVYAGAAGAVLQPTPVKEKQKILMAMDNLKAGGSTAGAAGIELAYRLAESNFVEGGVNRIILATDGDFNVGITDRNELQGFVERKRDSGIYLSVLGFGQGNYQDQLMQTLAQNGNGIAAYIDTLGEAQKVLIDEASSTLFPIANDVKIQVEFNPATVKEYRLLGYESRLLKQEDFNNDAVDAGEIGAGHSITAIYEITPQGNEGLLDESRYQAAKPERKNTDMAGELAFLKVRYKLPGETTSNLITQPVRDVKGDNLESRFAVAVAGFAQLLKDGKYTGEWGFEDALTMAIKNKGEDTFGYRAEFTQLIRKAMVAEEMR